MATVNDILKIARAETGLPIVTEIMDISQLDCFTDVDVIQIGARNMQNFFGGCSSLKQAPNYDTHSNQNFQINQNNETPRYYKKRS